MSISLFKSMLSTSYKRMNKEYHETQNIEGKTKKLRTIKLSKDEKLTHDQPVEVLDQQ